MCQPPSFYYKNANSICTHKQKDYDVIYIYIYMRLSLLQTFVLNC